MLLKVYASCGSGKASRISYSSIQSLLRGGRESYAYSDSELKKLAIAHQNGDAPLRRQIEERLTDINYHTEASSFNSGEYTTLGGKTLIGSSTIGSVSLRTPRGAQVTTTKPSGTPTTMSDFYRRHSNSIFGRVRSR